MNIDITKEVYERLGKHVRGFESPSDVIDRIIDFYESSETKKKPEISFIPNEEDFRQSLLVTKKAWKHFLYLDGTTKLEQWDAGRFAEKSNLRANLWSGSLRDWQNKNIKKLTLSINRPLDGGNIGPLPGDNKLKIQVNQIVKDHIDSIIEYCNNEPEHLKQLTDKEWCKNHLSLNFPLLILANQAENDADLHKRYWVTKYSVHGNEYRFCSQFGGNTGTGSKTLSEHHGEKFRQYLNLKNILLPEYVGNEIEFYVRDSN